MRRVAFIMLAKGHSKRLPNKNKRLYAGKEMFIWNLKKAMNISRTFYFNSDDDKMINIARSYGAKIIKRDKKLLDDDVPSRVLFINSINQMPENIDALISIQANSPNLDPKLIHKCYKIMRNYDFNELLTFDKHQKIYGSIWGISRKKLNKSPKSVKISDKVTQSPDCMIFDESIDIHTLSEFNKSLKLFNKKRGY